MQACEICNYITDRVDNYQRHIESKKHKLNVENSQFHYCDECEYKTIYKSSLTRHKKSKQDNIDRLFICELCNFKTLKRSSYDNHLISVSHKKKIKKHIINTTQSAFVANNTTENNSLDANKIKSIVASVVNEMQSQQLVASNNDNELLKTVVKCVQTLADKITTGNSHNNTHSNNNTHSHNTYNIVQILDYYNTNMKDAMTIEKFNELLRPIQTGDFLKIGETKKTYKKILSENYQTKLNEIPKQQRPLACYDKPNLCFIVNKDGEGWMVDQSNNEIKKSIYETHKGVLEGASNTMNDDTIMKKYESKVMSILMKSNIPKEDIEEVASELIKLISNKEEYKTLCIAPASVID